MGANSLVTKNCDPWTVYAGTPAHRIKTRPGERIRELEALLRAERYSPDGKYIPRGIAGGKR
jgi:hypothetical protein